MNTEKAKCPAKLECIHADTCLPDYWGGHHLAYVQIPVWPGMSLKDIKRSLHSELNQGAIGGNEPLTCDNSGTEGDKWFRKAHAAVNRIQPAKKGQRRFFTDAEQTEDDDQSVFAFFVFREYL